MGRRVLGSKQLICWSNVSRCVEGHGEEGTRKQAAHLLEQCKWKGMGRRVLGSKQLICWSNVSRCVEGHGEEGIRKQAAHLLEQCKPLCGRAWGGGY